MFRGRDELHFGPGGTLTQRSKLFTYLWTTDLATTNAHKQRSMEAFKIERQVSHVDVGGKGRGGASTYLYVPLFTCFNPPFLCICRCCQGFMSVSINIRGVSPALVERASSSRQQAKSNTTTLPDSARQFQRASKQTTIAGSKRLRIVVHLSTPAASA